MTQARLHCAGLFGAVFAKLLWLLVMLRHLEFSKAMYSTIPCVGGPRYLQAHQIR